MVFFGYKYITSQKTASEVIILYLTFNLPYFWAVEAL